MAIQFNPNKLKSIIDRSKQEAKKSGGNSDFVKMAFLPEGNHKIRLFFDPTGELYRTAVTHKSPIGQILCPDYLAEKDPSGTYPECDFCKAAEEQDDWKLNRRFNVMAYGQLIHTDVPGEYWEAGNVYCIVGNTRFKKAIDAFISSLYEDSQEYLMTLFDPQINGGYLSVTVTRGTQGSVGITIIPGKSVDAVPNIESWWKPLNEVWISDQFNADRYKEAAQKFNEEQNGTAPAEGGDKPADKPADAPAADKPADTPAPTPAPTPEPAATPAADGQIKCKDGTVVTLPTEVIERKCWTLYDASNPTCIVCPINVECMGESLHK